MESKKIGYVILEGAPSTENIDINIVSESGRRVTAEGTMQSGEEENRNGRCYLTSDLAREISCPRTMELIRTGNMKGEASHPTDSSMVRQQTIDVANTIVQYTKFWMEGNDVKAQFRGTNNALGDAFDMDLREGSLPSFSLRALGSLENMHGRNVVRNLRMITYDNVIYPSHPNAYATKVVSESANMISTPAAGYDTSTINDKGLLIPITNESVMNYIKTESANIKSIINQIDIFYESMKLIDNDTRVQLVTKAGDTFVINLESYIQDEIQRYVISHM